MFERFTHAAREAVVLAQEEARDAGADHIGAEHLLFGLLHDPAGSATRVLRPWGVDAARVSALARHQADLDEEALASLGIDLDEVRRTTEAEFGAGALDAPRRRWGGRRRVPGHIPFTAEAKQSLERALVSAVELHDRGITDVHLLLGLLRTEQGTAARLLARLGVTASTDELVRRVRDHGDQAA